MKKIIAVIACAATLSACAGPKEGVVVDRDHDDAWQSWNSGTQQCSGTGTSRSCWTTPGFWTYHDASWELRLNDGKGEEGWREVGEIAYNKCLVGDHYPECAQ